MNDRDTTKLLTKIGYLFLEKIGCREISTEIHIPTRYRDFSNSQDRHYIIDLLGIEREYLPPSKQVVVENRKTMFKLITRGIEIKVSKSDLKSGFIHNGCTFNYIMYPKDLFDPAKIHVDVGLIEVDLENFNVKVNSILNEYHLLGVTVVRVPKRKEIDDWTINHCNHQISATLTNQTKRWIIEEFK